MKIKQKMKLSVFATLLAVGVSLTFSPTTYAMNKTQFKDAVCSAIEGPGAEQTCKRQIDRTGKYTLGSSGKVIKFSDWKEATKADLVEAMDLGATTPAELEEARKEPDTPPVGDDCAGVETAIIKCDADNSGGIETNGVWALLLMAINILTAGIGIAAIGGIVYGSILYTTAGDNESQIKTAKEVIRNVIIGLIAYIGMFALLQFIIPGGVFT